MCFLLATYSSLIVPHLHALCFPMFSISLCFMFILETCQGSRLIFLLAVERTFLGYLRTSQALSMFGVVVAQLFTLQSAASSNGTLSYSVVGKPLAAACQGVAIYILLLGVYRWWRQQKTMVRGKVLVGGFELNLIALGVLLVCPTIQPMLTLHRTSCSSRLK